MFRIFAFIKYANDITKWDILFVMLLSYSTKFKKNDRYTKNCKHTFKRVCQRLKQQRQMRKILTM